ncbi:hypothetical protein DWW90_18260 [Parabacteroides sp. AF17-28]|nr:hypothetical protein DWW90_18260 [Parabacteroides sp. AF17-28]
MRIKHFFITDPFYFDVDFNNANLKGVTKQDNRQITDMITLFTDRTRLFINRQTQITDSLTLITDSMICVNYLPYKIITFVTK